MRALYPNQDCHVFGWTPELRYRRTYRKNVPAFANAASGLRTVGMVHRQCELPRSPSVWIDITPCGIELANRQAALIPEEREASWMQLVTTLSADDPGRLITIARFPGKQLPMEPPPITAE